ncbi:hypothetical protein PIROE2DRAFT_12195, partial [Piromyces sp. E2]
FSNAIDLNAIAFTYDIDIQIYTYLVKHFNKYSKENELNITLHLNLITTSNSTSEINYYGSMLESLLLKHDVKYDFIFYDNIYSSRYGPHLLSLNELLTKRHINMYNTEITKQSCSYQDKLVGLPIMLDYSVLYSNKNLLKKYNKKIPKTWNELVETAKYILKEETKHNNTELMAYNGLFTNTEIGTCSLYEFIYSYRKSKESPFPELLSQEVINALEMIKKMKNDISSDTQFQLPWGYTVGKLHEDNANVLFLKYWYYSNINPLFNVTALPGNKEGISGSTIGGYNLGINKYINENKKKACIDAFTYMTSKYMQTKIVKEKGLLSAISEIYNDDEICIHVDCEFFKSIQPIARPTNKINDYTKYSENFRNYIYEFLYGNITSYEVLKKINDITKIYYISINSEDTPYVLDCDPSWINN